MQLESPAQLKSRIEGLELKPTTPKVDPAKRQEFLEKKFGNVPPAPTTSPADIAKVEEIKARLNVAPIPPTATQETKQNIPTTPEKSTSPEKQKEKSLIEKAREKATRILESKNQPAESFKNYTLDGLASALRSPANPIIIDTLGVAGVAMTAGLAITLAPIIPLATLSLPIIGIATLLGGAAITARVMSYKSIRNKLLARKLEKLDTK